LYILCTYAWWWLNSQTFCHDYVKTGFYSKYIVVFVSVCLLFSSDNTTVWLYIRLQVFDCNNGFCWPIIVEGSTHAQRRTVHAFCYVVYCERLMSNQRTLTEFQTDNVIIDITLPPVASYICVSCWFKVAEMFAEKIKILNCHPDFEHWPFTPTVLLLKFRHVNWKYKDL